MKITFYFLLIATTLSHQHIPFIRHFDFISFSSVSFLSDQISLKFNALNSTFHLLLERNDFLIHSDTTLVIHNVLTSKESTHTIVAYPYKGIVKDANPLMKNWARILFHKDPSTTPLKKLDFDGHFAFNGQMYHISTIDFYRRSMRHGLDVSIIPKDQRDDIHRNARMILYKDTDSDNHKESHSSSQHKAEYGCGYIPSDVNEAAMDHFAKLKNQSRRLSKRAVTPATCFQSSKKVVSMAAAADCTYTTNFGGSENTLNRILSDWNSASQVYEQTFNIQLALSQVKILQGCGDFNGESLPWNVACSDAFTVNKRLSAFSQWRGSKSADTIGFSGPSVGVAWLNTLCEKTAFQQSDSSGAQQWVSGTGLSSIVPTEWKVVAHEVGHNFGAIHDCISIQCPSNCDGTSSCACCPCETSCDCKGQFIMHPTDNSALDQFSTCSMKYMCSGIQTAPKNCLLDPGTLKTLAAGICGNGVVELGEDCDCGATCSTDKCCIGTTCKFTAGSTCDDLNDECCNSCTLKPKGTLCRPSYDPCTYSQACTGNSGSCPSSVVIADGTSCKSNSTSATTCASGTCTSRIQQCKTLVVSGSYQTVAPCVGQDTQCSLLCQTASGVCLSLNGNFIDGTPCAGGGFCKSGACTGWNIFGLVGYYFQSQPQLAWPVAIILGLIVIGILYSCIKRCVRKRKQGSNVPLPLPIHPIGPSQVSPSTNFVRTNWVDPAAYNGAGYQPGYEYRPQMPEYVPMIPLSASIVAQQNFQQPSSAQSNSQPSSAHSNSQPWLPQQPLQPINTSVTRLQHQSSSQHLISSAASPRAPDTQYEIPSNTPRESPR